MFKVPGRGYLPGLFIYPAQGQVWLFQAFQHGYFMQGFSDMVTFCPGTLSCRWVISFTVQTVTTDKRPYSITIATLITSIVPLLYYRLVLLATLLYFVGLFLLTY